MGFSDADGLSPLRPQGLQQENYSASLSINKVKRPKVSEPEGILDRYSSCSWIKCIGNIRGASESKSVIGVPVRGVCVKR